MASAMSKGFQCYTSSLVECFSHFVVIVMNRPRHALFLLFSVTYETGCTDSTPGGDGIPAEVWKHGGDNLFSRLHQLITNVWEVGSVPKAWKDASIVTIYKKGDRTDCGNF